MEAIGNLDPHVEGHNRSFTSRASHEHATYNTLPCNRTPLSRPQLTNGLNRYEKEFEQVQDVFELQRNLNNSFAYDLVPSTTVITAALRAARRVNDFPTAVRIFEGALKSPRK